jgi:hypothetical protein
MNKYLFANLLSKIKKHGDGSRVSLIGEAWGRFSCLNNQLGVSDAQEPSLCIKEQS